MVTALIKQWEGLQTCIIKITLYNSYSCIVSIVPQLVFYETGILDNLFLVVLVELKPPFTFNLMIFGSAQQKCILTF